MTVGLKVTDEYGPSDADTAEVTILNVAPLPSISGPTSAEEGSTVVLVGSATDPAGANDTISYNWSVTKDGNPFATGTGANFAFTPDDNDTYVATLTASDEDDAAQPAPTTP